MVANFSSPGEGGLDTPQGLLVCGEAQAGKTTFTRMIETEWKERHPSDYVHHFKNSMAFRGLTALVFDSLDVNTDREVESERYLAYLDEFVNNNDIESVVRSLYEEPPVEAILRTRAVHSTVHLTAEHAYIRPVINHAGARLLADQVAHPDKHGLHGRPGLVIMDSRSHREGLEKYERADVNPLGTFVLTCPSPVAAERTEDHTDAQTAEMLADRNFHDFQRDLGRMTVVHDFPRPHHVDWLMRPGNDSAGALRQAGRDVAEHPEKAGLLVPTDILSLEQERQALVSILDGMLETVS